KKTENKFALLKQLILLPLLAVLVMGLAEREVRTEFINPDKKDEFHVTHPGKYTIADIEISGIQNPDRTALIQLSGLELGETIEIPGKDINNAVKKLWQQELFSDVKITASKIVGDDIWLDIFLQEQNKFLISIEFRDNQFILHGLEGCAFTELTFSANNQMPVAVNEFGMTSAGTGNTNDG